MTTEYSSKLPYEAYAISFDFADVLGVETIASATITAIDMADSSDVSTIVLDVIKQTNSPTVVFAWIRAGTASHRYFLSCKIVGSAGSLYELDAIQPVSGTSLTGITDIGLIIDPVIEPVSLADMKLHLRLDAGTFTDNVAITQSIAPGSHGITVGYTLIGTSVSVIGKNAFVSLVAGTNGTAPANGTVDVKLQDSDDGTTWVDVPSGAFAQVTTVNDNATYKKAYSGVRSYIRIVAQVLLAACEFGVDINVNEATNPEDSLVISSMLAARKIIEVETRRQLLTATWRIALQDWPGRNRLGRVEYGSGYGDGYVGSAPYSHAFYRKSAIVIPYGNLQSVTSVKYKDTNGTETTLVENTDYIVEKNWEKIGRLVLPWGKIWPVTPLYTSNPITIEFVCGWTTAAKVPAELVSAIKLVTADLFQNREAQVLETSRALYQVNLTTQRLIYPYILWDEV